MIVYEEAVLRTRISDHIRTIKNLEYQLKNAEDEIHKMLSKAALGREHKRLDNAVLELEKMGGETKF